MRHHIVGYQLNRDSSHRRALYKNLMSALIEHHQIKTTLPKAKAIQGQFEKLITQAKDGSLHNQRLIDQVLNRRELVKQLVDEIAPLVKNRPGGYTRIVKLGQRLGDAALMVRLELVVMPAEKIVTKEAKVPSKKVNQTKKTVPQKPAVVVKPTSILPKDITAPVLKNQTAVKPGMIRQKSGER
jgi:large subunit ribosomal protein L17